MNEEQKTISFFEKLKMRYDAYHECFLKSVWPERLLKDRLFSLICMACAGIICALIFYFLTCLLGLAGNNLFFNNLTFLVLSLPVLLLLWALRTHDVQEQIDKAQSNINSSKLNKGIDLLLTEGTSGNSNVNKRSAGLIMLAKLLQQDKTLRPEIDALTQIIDLTNANLKNVNLVGIYLPNANLEGAELQNANLQGANLKNAILQKANLVGANLKGTNLEDAILRGANLKNANLRNATMHYADLRDADLKDAKYNKYTKFPGGFVPEDEEMIEYDDYE